MSPWPGNDSPISTSLLPATPLTNDFTTSPQADPNTRGRGRRRSRPRPTSAEASAISEPPPKKRRYIPGGPGGGGRYVDVDGTEIPVGGTGPGGYNYVGPRGRIGRENAANGVQPVTYSRPRRESRRERPATRSRYSSAAAAAAAVVQGDGFKPREERGWEEFHQDLDIEVKFPMFSAAEVDGTIKQPATPCENDKYHRTQAILAPGGSPVKFVVGEPSAALDIPQSKGESISTPQKDASAPDVDESITPAPIAVIKRRTPDTPKTVPLPGPNPREKLTLPKPSFRLADPFASYELKGAGQLNYVDRTIANVGYQESDIYIRQEKRLIRVTEGTMEEDLDIGPSAKSDGETDAAIRSVGVGRVEYDMDEQDNKWLEAYNAQRKTEQVEAIKPAVFEITMTKIEKEWHALEKRIPKPNPKPPQTHRPRSSSAAAVNGEQSGAAHTHTAPEPGEEESYPKINLVVGGNKRKRNSTPKAVWRLPLGAPVIPQAVYNSVESSLQRFTIRKRKEYAAEACKYWTLKREARRGAALLKRLQLQMETFSSMEITRRNFVGMGAADVEKLRVLCGEIRARESEKLKDADMLRVIVDTVYFPTVPMLWPILEKAQALDGKGCLLAGFIRLREKLEERCYTSLSTFSADFGAVFSAAIGLPAMADTAEVKTQVDGVVSAKDLTTVYKEKRKLAKRIVKAVQASLEDAMRKESELCRKPFEKELRDLDRLLETSISLRQDSLTNSLGEDASDEEAHGQLLVTNGETHQCVHNSTDKQSTEHALTNGDLVIHQGGESLIETAHAFKVTGSESRNDLEIASKSVGLAKASEPVPVPSGDVHQQPTPEDSVTTLGSNGITIYEHQPDEAAVTSLMGSSHTVAKQSEPPTPPLSSKSEVQAPLPQGGISWYMDPLDPMGTTIHDERWTGREVVRGMSEELSDMDEEELSGLVDVDMTETAEDLGDGTLHPESGIAAIARRKNGAKRRRWRGYR
ncbi:MAG: hypothetical protein FRX48_02723 [Lasallia pustulata]|uniref:Enhancer of polycomb-like N-terminal domain-containing protein n=1 Tax=Lasallia pustulata TaxID=136370 RepID=A0A5M8PTN1_9LECA|nr:MAG: hypothetical protein FRX48_02723 [Lasallia pustulata]